MLPHVEPLHVFGKWLYEVSFFRRVVLNLSIVLLLESMESLWHDRCRVSNPCNLCSQVKGLGAEVEWVGKNLFVKIASKAVLDSSCFLDILWF
jgi:hypothetical protein